MSFLFPTGIVGGSIDSSAQVAFYEAEQGVFAFTIANCYIVAYYCGMTEEHPTVNTAGFCTLIETRGSCRITALAIHDETLFAAIITTNSDLFKSDGSSTDSSSPSGAKNRSDKIGTSAASASTSLHIFAGSIAQLMKQYHENPGTSAIAFLSPLPARVTRGISEPIRVLKILSLIAADSSEVSIKPNSTDEHAHMTVIAVITESGRFYHGCSEVLELRPVELAGPCLSIVQCRKSDTFQYILLGGVGYVALINPIEGDGVRYLDLGQMSRQDDEAPIHVMSVIKYSRYVYIFSADSRVLQLKVGDWKALRTLNRPLQNFALLGVVQSNDLFYCYGTNGTVRSLTCDALKLYNKVVLSSFKYLRHYSDTAVVCMHVSKHGVCVILADNTVAIYRQGESPDSAAHPGNKNPRSMLRSRTGLQSSGADRSGQASANTYALEPSTLALSSIFYGHTPFASCMFLGEQTMYSYTQYPGNSCCLTVRGDEYGQAKMFDSFPECLNLFAVDSFLIGFCTKEDALRLKLIGRADSETTVSLFIYDFNHRKFILSYSFKKLTKITLLTASYRPAGKLLQIYFAADGLVFYFRDIDISKTVHESLVPLCAKISKLKSHPDSFSTIIAPQVPNYCYCVTKTGVVYQVSFGADTKKVHTRIIFQPPRDAIDYFGVYVSPSGRYLLIGVTIMATPSDSQSKNALDDSSLRSDIYIVSVDRENTRIILKQTVAENASLSDIPEGPNALAVGYLAGSKPDMQDPKGAGAGAGDTVSCQGDFADMVYAVMFKYRSEISVYSVAFNKRIALISSLHLDPTLQGHQMYLNSDGSLIVYIANGSTTIRFTPLNTDMVYALLHVRTKPGGCGSPQSADRRKSQTSPGNSPGNKDSMINTFMFGEGTYFDDTEVVTSWAQPQEKELTIRLETTHTGINPTKCGVKDHIQTPMEHSYRARTGTPYTNTPSAPADQNTEPSLALGPALNSVTPTCNVEGRSKNKNNVGSVYESLSGDSDLSNEIIEAYEQNLQSMCPETEPKLTEAALDNLFEQVDILDEESVLRKLDSTKTREALSESIILTMKDILLSSDSSVSGSRKSSAHTTPTLAQPRQEPSPAKPGEPPVRLPAISSNTRATTSPDVAARIRVGSSKPVVVFADKVGNIGSAVLPGPKYDTVSSVQHMPQAKNVSQPGSQAESPMAAQDSKSVPPDTSKEDKAGRETASAAQAAQELRKSGGEQKPISQNASPGKDTDSPSKKTVGTVFSPTGHDDNNHTIKLPSGPPSAFANQIDLSLSMKKSTSLLQSIATARMNINSALLELEKLQQQCSRDEYASILASAAPQLYEEAIHLSQVQSKVSTLASLHSSGPCPLPPKTPDASSNSFSSGALSPRSSVLVEFANSDGYIPASQLESILNQFGNNFILSLKSFIAQPSARGPNPSAGGVNAAKIASSPQPQPLTASELANVLQLPPLTEDSSKPGYLLM